MDLKILHRFEYKTCVLCENTEVNEYYDIDKNFIEYDEVFHSLHEILNDALNFNVGST